MLIVTADDWGLRPEVTDAIRECWGAGAVTSASAMVAMTDSERAFALAAEEGLPLGLHLNLTTPFTGPAGAERHRRHSRAVGYFAGARLRRFGFDPTRRDELNLCIADQLTLFGEATGTRVRHADGHQHVHVCPTVLTTPALGSVRTLRRAHSFVLAQAGSPKRAYRGLINRAIRRRFISVPFASIRDLHPELGGVGLEDLRELAMHSDVEVMCHPAWEDEREALHSPLWRQLLAEVPTGSPSDLSRS